MVFEEQHHGGDRFLEMWVPGLPGDRGVWNMDPPPPTENVLKVLFQTLFLSMVLKKTQTVSQQKSHSTDYRLLKT